MIEKQRINYLDINTDSFSQKKVKDAIANEFQPKVVLVNHEKRLGVDTTCANLAIKYNMIYISVYQLIKHHIETQTQWGAKLLAGQRSKAIQLASQVRDEFNELEFSPVHFD